jgi:hypothetical protein
MVEELSKAVPGSDGAEFLKAMLAPMQQQSDVLRQAFEKQAEFQRELTERALAPMKQMYAELQEAAETTRAAGEALRQAGDMLTKQATAMNQALKLAKPFLEAASPSQQESGRK